MNKHLIYMYCMNKYNDLLISMYRENYSNAIMSAINSSKSPDISNTDKYLKQIYIV